MKRKFGKTTIEADTITVTGVTYSDTYVKTYTVKIQTSKMIISAIGIPHTLFDDFEIEISKKEYDKYIKIFFKKVIK